MAAENTIRVGDSVIPLLFQGDMGIKRVYLGDELIYERPGGFFFLELDTKPDEGD